MSLVTSPPGTGYNKQIHQIRKHIETQFAQAEINPSPFPHLLIENFFPEEVFASILNLNPFQIMEGEEWIKRQASKDPARLNSTPYYHRRQIHLDRHLLDLQSEPYQEFWRAIHDCFLSSDHWFENLVIQKYKIYFEIRFGDFLKDSDFLKHFKTEFFLQRHRPGYYIGPHTDVPTRVFTAIFSFADQEGFEDYGTQVCVPKNPKQRCWGNRHYDWDNFDVVKVAPYKPNNFFLFFKTRQSFHAVKTISSDVPNERYGMQFQFYEPPTGVFEDLSTPDLMKAKHHKSSQSPRVKSPNKIQRLLQKIQRS